MCYEKKNLLCVISTKHSLVSVDVLAFMMNYIKDGLFLHNIYLFYNSDLDDWFGYLAERDFRLRQWNRIDYSLLKIWCQLWKDFSQLAEATSKLLIKQCMNRQTLQQVTQRTLFSDESHQLGAFANICNQSCYKFLVHLKKVVWMNSFNWFQKVPKLLVLLKTLTRQDAHQTQQPQRPKLKEFVFY